MSSSGSKGGSQGGVESRRGGTRVDIQWMRALAVGLVVLCHFWPGRVHAGYVGVDVFFVISGFLMTAHLMRHPPHRFGDLAAFWGRRVRRLLPAAFTVIVVVIVVVMLVGPSTQWAANGRAAMASAAYVENWDLAKLAVDYLAASGQATAFQHYWSLSVEEQFYLVWPLLVLVAGLIAAHSKLRLRPAVGIGVALVVVASFAWCVYYTGANSAAAYFVTTTRMWELAAGGAAAIGYPVVQRLLDGRPVVKVSLVAVGVGLILWAALAPLSNHFPGWVAAIPVSGAALVIAVGPADFRFSFDRILRIRPAQWLGDVSYSVYLWHWPVVVILPWVLGRPLSWPYKLGAIAVVLALAGASKMFIEDRFRGEHPLGVPLRRTFIFLLIGMLATVGTGFGATLIARQADKPLITMSTIPARSAPSTAPSEEPTETSPAEPPDCTGANMLLNPACSGQNVHGDELLVTPVQAQTDKSPAYDLKCRWQDNNPQRFPFCTFGSDAVDATQIALFGNSHANPYLTPLESIADANGWGMRTYLSANCFPAVVDTGFFTKPAAVQGCLDWARKAIADMKAHDTKLVVMSARPRGNNLGPQTTQIIGQLVAAGMRVLVIRDMPRYGDTDFAPDCVALHLKNLSACDAPMSSVLKTDPQYNAALAMDDPSVATLDLTGAVCDQTTCYRVVGGIIVYFDDEHMTATFANTLRAPLEQAVMALMGS